MFFCLSVSLFTCQSVCFLPFYLSFICLPACLLSCLPASKPGSTFVTNLSRIGMIFLFFCIVLVVLVGELRSKNWQSQIFRQNSSLSNFAFLVSKWPKRYTSSMLLIFFHWFLFRMINKYRFFQDTPFLCEPHISQSFSCWEPKCTQSIKYHDSLINNVSWINIWILGIADRHYKRKSAIR